MASVRNVAAVGLIVSLISARPALAEEYPFDVAKKYPASMRAWQTLVPSDFRRAPWIFRLDGTAGPMDTVSVHGRVFLYGSVCKPHDCAGNFVAFLLAKDGGEAFGELSSDTLGAKNRYFGTPDAEVRGLLDKLLNQ